MRTSQCARISSSVRSADATEFRDALSDLVGELRQRLESDRCHAQVGMPTHCLTVERRSRGIAGKS